MNRLGALGERAVFIAMERKGFRTIAKNLRLGKLEIDLVMYKSGIYHLVEVKTTSTGSGVTPGSQMTTKKCRDFERAAQLFSKKYRISDFKLLFAEVLCNKYDVIQSIQITSYQ